MYRDLMIRLLKLSMDGATRP